MLRHRSDEGRQQQAANEAGSTLRPLQRLRCAPEEMDSETLDMVTFAGRSDLLRASSIASVMRCGGAVFQNSAGSAETYALSEEVTAIDAFLSQNWDVSRVKKFLCLMLHFNLGLAFLGAMVAVAILAGAASLDAHVLMGYTLPMSVWQPGFEEEGEIRYGLGCTLLMVPAFFCGAMFGQDLLWLVGLRGSMVFLDKTCIDQVDKERQRDGIRKLGAFLRSSSRMVVLYSDVYLMKLWTVYETACFLALHSTKCLIVVPVHQPIVVFGLCASSYVIVFIFAMLTTEGQSFMLAQALLLALVIITLAVFFRWSAREKEAIYQRVATFHVGHCRCAVEEDRPLVNRNIAHLMRAIGVVDQGATEHDALEAFDGFVRSQLPHSLTSSISQVGLDYWHMVAISLCIVAPIFTDMCVLSVITPHAEWVARWRVCNVVYEAITILGFLPALAAAMSAWCRLCMHFRGFQECVFLGSGIVPFVVVYFFLDLSLQMLVSAATIGSSRNSCAAGLAALLIVSVAGARRLFTWGQQSPEEEEAEAAGAPEVQELLGLEQSSVTV